MIQKITGIVKAVSATQTGINTNNSQWKKKDIVINSSSIGSKFNIIAIPYWNLGADAIEKLNINPGDLVEAEFTIFSEEYKEKWIAKTIGRSLTKLKMRREDQAAEIVKNLKGLIHASDCFERENNMEMINILNHAIEKVATSVDIPETELKTIQEALSKETWY